MKRWVLLAVVLGVAVGCSGENKRERPTPDDLDPKKDGKPEPKKTGDPEPKKDDKVAKKDDTVPNKDGEKPPARRVPVPPLPRDAEKPVQLLAVKFGEDHLADSDTTTRIYKGKYVELTGLVTKIAWTEEGKPVLELRGAEKALLGVGCATVDKTPWLDVLPGQVVVVRGVGAAEAGGIVKLEKCYLLDVIGEKPATMTASELSAEYGKGTKAADQKYRGKHLVVTGEVKNVEDDDARVVLKIASGPAVSLKPPAFGREEDRAKALKTGDKVRAVGLFDTKDTGVELREVFLLEPAP